MSDNNNYHISNDIVAHKGDTKAIYIRKSDASIISCSRDKSVKFWKVRDGEVNAYDNSISFYGHEGFVNSVICTDPILPDYPEGMIVTGCMDKKIRCFSPDRSDPVTVLDGHQENVCCLSSNKNLLISGSWDLTARLWDLKDSKEVTVYKHTATVWDVLGFYEKGYIVTASADKNVYIFSIVGNLLKTLTGHTDCVRSLSHIYENNFASCANDGIIIIWNIDTGDIIKKFLPQNDIIYNICYNDNNIISCGENGNIRISEVNTDNFKEFKIPVQTAWTIAVLPNGDLAIGSSDGHIRIFTKYAERFNPGCEALMEAMQNERKKDSTKQKYRGTFAADKLPGLEALERDGTYDSEIRVIADNGESVCYKWCSKTSIWEKVGVVTGDANEKPQTSEDDYNFNVDVEGIMYKLRCGKHENPYDVADSFLAKNDLPYTYREQIVKFILDNTSMSVTTPRTVNSSLSYAADLYQPKDFYRYDKFNAAKIKECIESFNNDLKLRQYDIDSIISLTNTSIPANTEALNTVKKLLVQWPSSQIYPLLDTLRIAYLNIDLHSDRDLFDIILILLFTSSCPKNLTLCIKILTNISSIHPKRELINKLIKKELSKLISYLSVAEFDKIDIKVQKIFTVFYLNLTKSVHNDYFNDRNVNNVNRYLIALEMILKRLIKCNDAHVIYRTLESLKILVPVYKSCKTDSDLTIPDGLALILKDLAGNNSMDVEQDGISMKDVSNYAKSILSTFI